MSNKSVKYSDGSRPGHKGSSRYEHDSGVGSLSSEQASTGGRPDRRFTAEDIERQRRNPHAAAEALRAKDDELLKVRQKYTALQEENRKLLLERKTFDKDWNALCDERSAFEARVKALEVTNEQLTSELEKLKTENYHLHRRLGASVTSESDYTMSGGLGETSSGIPHRSKSKRESPDMMKNVRDRIKPKQEDPKQSSSSKSHGRRRSSVSDGSGSRRPYIEEMPSNDVGQRTRPPIAPSAHYNTAHYDNYTTTTMAPASYNQMQSVRDSNLPRTVPSSVGSYEETGDYVPFPLPKAPESSRSDHRRSRK